NVICVVSYGAPIGQFTEIVKKKSAANYDGSPYVTCLLSSFLWLFYGLLDPDDGVLIVTVKYTGFIIMDIVIFGTVIAITLLAFEESARRAFTGVLTATFSVVSYAAPLTVVRTVIRTKSVEYMPFFLILTLFASGLAWTACALLLGDFYVLVPNAAGIVLGAIQLIVYFIYMKRSSKAMADEGSADMVKEGDTVQDFDVDGVAKEKNQTLRSPSLSRQYSVKELVKTLSFIPNGSRTSLQPESDVEIGVMIAGMFDDRRAVGGLAAGGATDRHSRLMVKYFGLVMLDVVFLGTAMAVTLVAFHEGSRRTFVRVLCATFTVLMYAAFLSVVVPNAVGIVLGSVQLIVYLMYENKSSTSLPPSKSTEIMVEDGQTKMVKDIEGNNDDMLDFTEVGEAIGKIHSPIPADVQFQTSETLPLSRQYSFRHFRSTASWGPNRSGPNFKHQNDAETGRA
ncbi:hypothetical protein RJ639_002237, partial [Escallonia herrerae]